MRVIELLINAPDRKTRQTVLEHALRALEEGVQPGDDDDSSGAVRGDASLLLGRLDPARVLQRLLATVARGSPREDAREGAYRARAAAPLDVRIARLPCCTAVRQPPRCRTCSCLGPHVMTGSGEYLPYMQLFSV